VYQEIFKRRFGGHFELGAHKKMAPHTELTLKLTNAGYFKN
jgi:hypothetical protein